MAMRSSLRTHLEGLKSSRSWEHITEQIGMFCYTGLTEEEVRGGEGRIRPTSYGRGMRVAPKIHEAHHLALSTPHPKPT